MVDWFNIAIWSLVGTWALVVGTLGLMYWQTRTGQKLNSANAVMLLRERFDGGRMRAARRHLSDRLIKNAHEDITSMEVITFFELVGTLTHRRILDDDLVWEAFGTWISAYYWALRHPIDLIADTRTSLGDPLVWHEFEWLATRVEAMDRLALRQVGGSFGDPGEGAARILRRESQLESL
ncbi:MAG: hypothetical protein L3K18_01385 [Thermoplasmata archaeon]|nr:hypothetical protein [Thermoplasmata archaeon]MCI4355781.1 hypothetical protein [Thermoplasmata archaeon]